MDVTFEQEPGEMHWRDGWHFKCVEDGAVRLRDFATNRIAIIPAPEWVSLIHHLAAEQTTDSFQQAIELHNGVSRVPDQGWQPPKGRTMTVMACPHGCGGFVDTGKDDWCPSCRRGLNETEVVIPDDEQKSERDAFGNPEYPGASPAQRKAAWCWQWFGSARHRMRCRLPTGHTGEHFDHEERRPIGSTLIVATDGTPLPAPPSEPPT